MLLPQILIQRFHVWLRLCWQFADFFQIRNGIDHGFSHSIPHTFQAITWLRQWNLQTSCYCFPGTDQFHLAVCCLHFDMMLFHFFRETDDTFHLLFDFLVDNICSDAAPCTGVTALYQIRHRLAYCHTRKLVLFHQLFFCWQKISFFVRAAFDLLFQNLFQLRIQRRCSRISIHFCSFSFFFSLHSIVFLFLKIFLLYCVFSGNCDNRPSMARPDVSVSI